MGLDAHMTNFSKQFFQVVTNFIMSTEGIAPCGTGESMFNCEACTTNTAGRQVR